MVHRNPRIPFSLCGRLYLRENRLSAGWEGLCIGWRGGIWVWQRYGWNSVSLSVSFSSHLWSCPSLLSSPLLQFEYIYPPLILTNLSPNNHNHAYNLRELHPTYGAKVSKITSCIWFLSLQNSIEPGKCSISSHYTKFIWWQELYGWWKFSLDTVSEGGRKEGEDGTQGLRYHEQQSVWMFLQLGIDITRCARLWFSENWIGEHWRSFCIERRARYGQRGMRFLSAFVLPTCLYAFFFNFIFEY